MIDFLIYVILIIQVFSLFMLVKISSFLVQIALKIDEFDETNVNGMRHISKQINNKMPSSGLVDLQNEQSTYDPRFQK